MQKGLRIRLSEELLKDLRKEAARQTIRTGQTYSMNRLINDILARAMARRKQARKERGD